MASLDTKALFLWSFHLGAILAGAVVLVPTLASAEIILDEFDEPFEISASEINDDPLIQTGIGPLDAERRSRIYASSSSQPTGSANANLSRPSAMTFEIEELNPFRRPPLVALNLDYSFAEMDLSEGGRNDRVALDFAHLQSSIPIGRIDVHVGDRSQSGNTFVLLKFDLPPRDSPFTLEFPFDSFRSRAGGPGRIEFERVFRLYVGIIPSYYADADEINFSAVLERVRITRAVPEPATFMIAACALLAMMEFKSRTRELKRCARNLSVLLRREC